MSILSNFLMPSLGIVGIPDIMKKIVWLAALTVALCATVASCGDDEPDNGANVTASAEVSDFGGERLISIDEGIDYSYNSDGTLRQVKGLGLNMIFDYRKVWGTRRSGCWWGRLERRGCLKFNELRGKG